jgi:metal-sulfur cluster biosynthetic enzyme
VSRSAPKRTHTKLEAEMTDQTDTEATPQPNLGAYNDDEEAKNPGLSQPDDAGAAAADDPSVSDPGTTGEAGAVSGDISSDSVREALKAVVDPEIGIDIVNLGLIYEVKVEENNIKVEMTLTGPGCPIGPMLQSQVYGIAAGFPGARNVQVDLVWSPPWDPRTMASEEAKDILGIW